MKTKPLCGIPWKVSKPKSKITPVPWLKDATIKIDRPIKQTKQSHDHLDKGQNAENQAKEFLLKKGLKLINQNYRAKCGEIDLIMADHNMAIVVEVRYRESKSHGGAVESIDNKKRKRIINCASLWWNKQGQYQFSSLRFDVIAIEGQAPITWLKNAFCE
jgi:putative endonuclease